MKDNKFDDGLKNHYRLVFGIVVGSIIFLALCAWMFIRIIR